MASVVARYTKRVDIFGHPVSAPPINTDALLRHAQLVLSISRTSGVDVTLRWLVISQEVVKVSSTCSIVDAVYSIVQRWTMFEFYMPRKTLSIAAMKMLRRPTPLLERVWLQEMQDGDIISGLISSQCVAFATSLYALSYASLVGSARTSWSFWSCRSRSRFCR